MEFDQNGFYKKLEKEIARLEKTADRLEGMDRDLVKNMVHALELECARFRSSEVTFSEVREQEREEARSTTIAILNKIETQVRDLDVILGKDENRGIGSRTEANRIVDQFFLDCQLAEEQMKQYAFRGLLSKEQIRDLNIQLKGLVHQMIQLSKKSDLLTDAVLESYEAMIVGP
ncbi:MAG: hypothetical protein LUO93_03260 [Methanomicrobiales archaeon]|nr:hypothetical protein [Methanomicrobiales archaeon]